MTDNNTQPIDPASCEPGKWWLVRTYSDVIRPAMRWSYLEYWKLAGHRAEFTDEQVTVLSELVRADEAQKTADYWRRKFDAMVAQRLEALSECEKAQTERDKATDGLTHTLEVLGEENQVNSRQRKTIEELTVERDEAQAEIGHLKDADSRRCELYNELLAERDGLREKLNAALSALADWETPDANNPAQLRLAADVVEDYAAGATVRVSADELRSRAHAIVRTAAADADAAAFPGIVDAVLGGE